MSKSPRAECPVCALIVPYGELKKDWRGIYVCDDCQDEPPVKVVAPVDAIALHHPKPFLDNYEAVENIEKSHRQNQKPTFS